jgi:hypothetical protein
MIGHYLRGEAREHMRQEVAKLRSLKSDGQRGFSGAAIRNPARPLTFGIIGKRLGISTVLAQTLYRELLHPRP